MPMRYKTKQATDENGEPLFDADGKPVMQTTTTFIPGNTASKLAREYWERNEQAFAELQSRKAERRRQLAEQAFWRKYGLPGIHR